MNEYDGHINDADWRTVEETGGDAYGFTSGDNTE